MGEHRVEAWVSEVARHTRPARVLWCDGSASEATRIVEEMLADATLHPLNPQKYPGCYLHRSYPHDVARTEHLAFLCTRDERDAGPTNRWMAPSEARDRIGPLLEGSMEGRTMYVVPYLLGPEGSEFARAGVEITDSPYVVLNLRILTRMGAPGMDRIRKDGEYVAGLHSLGDRSPERRYIAHFPRERLIWSVGSGFGGNALLARESFALRMASVMGHEEGWLAEPMLILEVLGPRGQVDYVGAALSSPSDKTNLAMLVSPLEEQGYRIRTISADFSWLHAGEDGRLWAINPEAGFFGVLPGTNEKTKPSVMKTIDRDTIFTNVAMTPDKTPWWEGRLDEPPKGLVTWMGEPWDGTGKACHPNARYTAPARRCPSLSSRFEDPEGVPISAIVFGGRRARLAPLVVQSRSWQHGVFLAASMGSDAIQGATGKDSVVRRDPFAMTSFCGYHMGDYFDHWLAMEKKLTKPPLIFHANWSRVDAGGRCLWPGYGENLRVVVWMVERARGQGEAQETPVGWIPSPGALNLEGLRIGRETMEELLAVDRGEWTRETAELREFFSRFGERLPQELADELDDLEGRLAGATA